MKICKFSKAAFAMALKFRRGNRTLSEIAIELGIGKATLSRFENAQLKPSVDHFATICSWLDMPMDTFFDHA